MKVLTKKMFGVSIERVVVLLDPLKRNTQLRSFSLLLVIFSLLFWFAGPCG